MTKRLGPLAFAVGVGAGVALGLSLGAYALGWGPTLAFPATVLLLSMGAWNEDDDGEEITTLLRLALGITGGYLATAVPLTWLSLDGATQARVAREVWSRWAVIALALPGGVTVLVLRMRRRR